MSKWTEIRDTALDVLKDGAFNVVEETKQAFLNNFIEAGVPVIEEYAAQFVASVKEQAKSESSWVKIRDVIVIPIAIEIVLYIGKEILKMVSTSTRQEVPQG